jgi:hypothetical protein
MPLQDLMEPLFLTQEEYDILLSDIHDSIDDAEYCEAKRHSYYFVELLGIYKQLRDKLTALAPAIKKVDNDS